MPVRMRGIFGFPLTYASAAAESDLRHDSGVDYEANVKHARFAFRFEHHRINALLDGALDLTFPCSDPVAITISGG